MAAYGHILGNGDTQERADAFMNALFANVVALPGSGRDVTTACLSGTDDVLVSYENEAILDRQNGERLDYVVPETTLLIENPGAVLKDAHAKARAWLEFLLTPESQAEFARLGFRPVGSEVEVPAVEGANDPSDPFPAPR